MALSLCGSNYLGNYQIIQRNGQIIYSPARFLEIPPPPQGTEIFVGNLPPDLLEDELIRLFRRIDHIYDLRLMVDFSGKNRGYAFVRYFTVEAARSAVKAFDNHQVRQRTKLSVTISTDNRRLFLGGVPARMPIYELDSILKTLVDGVVAVIMYPDPHVPEVNRNYAFLEFESQRSATIARRQLCHGNLMLWDYPIYVEWAEPLPNIDPEIMKKITKLYLSHLAPETTSYNLRAIVSGVVPERHITKIYKHANYAFIHFDQREVAERAMEMLDGLPVQGHLIKAEWARPMEFSREMRMQQGPANLCRSVPIEHRIRVHEERRKMKMLRKNASNNYFSVDTVDSDAIANTSSIIDSGLGTATGTPNTSGNPDEFEIQDWNDPTEDGTN